MGRGIRRGLSSRLLSRRDVQQSRPVKSVKLWRGAVKIWKYTYLLACDADDDEKLGHGSLISQKG